MLHELGFARSAEVAVALHAAAALERYERLMRDLVARGGGADLHRRATEEIEAIRKDVASLPRLRIAVVELSISHAELIFSLLKAGALGEAGERRVRDAVACNEERSGRLRALVAGVLSTRA